MQHTTVFGGSVLATHGYGMFNGFHNMAKDIPVTELLQHLPTLTCGQLIDAVAPIVLALIAMFYNEERHYGRMEIDD